MGPDLFHTYQDNLDLIVPYGEDDCDVIHCLTYQFRFKLVEETYQDA